MSRQAIGVATVLAALVFALASHDLARQHGGRVDLSLGRLPPPSTAVREAVGDLSGPTEAILFFAPRDPIAARLEPWLDRLAAASEQLRVRRVDPAQQPALADHYGVEGQGVLVLAPEGTEGAALVLGDRPAVARRVLRRLEGAFLETLARALAPPRPAYFVQGHGEPALRDTPRALATLLERSRYELRTWDLARPPERMDEGLVLVVGPTAPFEPEEAAALARFVEAGGRLLVATDSAAAARSLGPIGVRAREGVLRGIDGGARLRAIPSAAHPVTAAVADAVWVDGALALERSAPGAVAPLRIRRAFRDVDGDGRRGVDEPIEAHPVAVAIRGTAHAGGGEGRVLFLGDADLVSDDALARPATETLLRSSLAWLADRPGERVAPPIATSDAELEVEHTDDEAQAVALFLVFGVPLPFFALSLIARRRGS